MPIELLIVIVGLLISLFGSVVGFGGGIFMVPILVTVFGYDMNVAVGAAIVSLIPSTLISTLLNRKEGRVDFRMGILLELPTMLGVIIGSLLLTYISTNHASILFALMVFAIGISFFVRKRSGKTEKEGTFYKLNKIKPRFVIKNPDNFVAYRISLVMDLFFGLTAGTLAGLFGVGGGFLKTPIMLKVFKIPAKIAAATTLFMIFITSVTGTVSHALQGNIILTKAWPVVLGFAIGAVIGHRVNAHIKEAILEKLIGFSLLAAGLMMLANFLT